MLLETPVRVFRILFCKVIPLVAAFFPAGPQADDKRLFLLSFPQSAAHSIVGFEHIINDNGDKFASVFV